MVDRRHAKRAGWTRAVAAVAACPLLAGLSDAAETSDPQPAPVFSFGGRIGIGAVYRLEDPDLRLPYALNGAAAGVAARNGTGANADDANLNFRRHQAISRAITGSFDVQARYRDTRALLRLKGWRDDALRNDGRSWGSAANNYAAGAALSDAGAPPLTRFSALTVGEAWIEQAIDAGRWRLAGRAGQQTIDWGAGAGFAGGLEVLTPRDLPASRRAGSLPADARVPVPALFASAEYERAIRLEGFYQTHFRPNAVDMCGTFFAVNDYMANGCDKVMSGPPFVSDRARVALGAYLKRLPTPKPQGAQFGGALLWRLDRFGLRLGAYHAQYTSRVAVPGLRKSTRAGPAYIPGDPDGRNLAFFSEHPDAVRINAVTFEHRGGAYGELSWRPNQPLLFGPGDGLPPFISANVPAQLRALATSIAPGGLFHGYERYPMWQAQLGFRQAPDGPYRIGYAVEVVAKHVTGLPDQALRRYGRSDVFGAGPVDGVCVPTMTVPALQCSQDGYVSQNAAAWRARVEARLPALAPALVATAALGFVYDVHGWSADSLINQGRRSANASLRFEYRQRYQLELGWQPIWGGRYNASADRDVFAISAGIRF